MRLPDEFWLILQGEDWELDILEYGYSSGEESVSDSNDADDVFDVKLSLSHSVDWTSKNFSASVKQQQTNCYKSIKGISKTIIILILKQKQEPKKQYEHKNPSTQFYLDNFEYKYNVCRIDMELQNTYHLRNLISSWDSFTTK